MSAVDVRFTVDGLVTIFMALGQFSLLWKDNPWYRLSMHIYFGCWTGYNTVIMIDTIQRTGWAPVVGGKDLLLIISLILGVLLFARFNKGISYLYRYPTGFLVGITTATMMVGWMDAQIFKQISATIKVFAGVTQPFNVISTLLFVVTFATSLLFFVFSLPLTRFKPMAYTIRIGRYFLMLMLGCYYASIIQRRTADMMAPMMLFLLGFRG